MMNANNQAAQAEQQGAQNLLNTGLTVASLAMGRPPQFGGGGGSPGGSFSLANLFGGGSNWAQNNPGAMGSAYYGPQAPG